MRERERVGERSNCVLCMRVTQLRRVIVRGDGAVRQWGGRAREGGSRSRRSGRCSVRNETCVQHTLSAATVTMQTVL